MQKSLIFEGEQLRTEYRIIMPIAVEEYQIGQLWSVAKASILETGGGEGVEVIVNKPYEKQDGEKGQYTRKIYYDQSKVPRAIRALAPRDSLEVVEKSWNAYPSVRTVQLNEYMGDRFWIDVKSLYLHDLGESENVHKLPDEEWDKTNVVYIDIADERVSSHDYKEELDPTKFKSKKTNRGPLDPDWIDQLRAKKNNSDPDKVPYMCAYKLVSCCCKMLGLKARVENMIQNEARRFLANFNRQVFCWMDNWIGMTMEEIREFEEKTKKELDVLRQAGEARGTLFQTKG